MTRSSRIRILGQDAARARLACGVSIAAMVGALGVNPAAAQTVAGLHAAFSRGGIPAAATAAMSNPAINSASAAAMAAAAGRAAKYQAQIRSTVSLAQQAQSAARAAAAAMNQGVPDGLVFGGLQVAPNVVSAANDPTGLHTWDGASLPTKDPGAANQIDIVQTNPQAVLDWTTFNVGQHTTLYFDQQKNGVAQPGWIVLNRVVGQLMPNGLRNPNLAPAPSQILGSIKADGTVLVLNQNGVIFGPTSQINVNSLVASSLEIGHALETVTGGVATPTTLSQRDNEFLAFGLLGYADLNPGAPQASTYTFSAQATGAQTYDPLPEGEVQAQAGATIASAPSGFLMLLAPRVVNGGALSSPEGQISLVSGRGVTFTRSQGTSTSIDPNLRGLALQTFNLGGETGDYVDNTVAGTIDAPQGYISLQATGVGAVLDAGALTSTTSVSRNGYINLQGANIQLAPNAVIAITPDTGPATIPQDPVTLTDFKSSQIRIGDTGAAIDIGANSLIYAPNANVSIGADPGQASLTNTEALLETRVFIDSGATIDVAGVQNVSVPASVNSIKIDPVTQNTLQDSPTYRAGFLNGATVYVDPRLSGVLSNGVAWVGSPLIPAASYYQQVGLTASALMTAGGSVTIGAASTAPGTTPTSIPDVIIKAGATIDISGGWRTFQAGVVQTTRLIDASGEVVDIGSADPNDTYVGLYNGFTAAQPRWGISQTYVDPILSGNRSEGQYTEGRDAGVLTIKSSVVALDGQVFADAFAGAQQIVDSQPGTAKGPAFGDVRNLQGAPSQLPAGGYLDIQALGIDNTGAFTGGGDVNIVGSGSYTPVAGDLAYGQTASLAPDGSLIIPQRPTASVLPTARLDVISLNADAISSMGLSQLSVQTSGNITVSSDASVTLDAGGAFEAIAGRALTINGKITAPSGSIDLRTADLIDSQGLGGSVLLPTNATVGSFDITINGQLNAAGRWANDYNAASGQLVGSAYLGGGEITLFAAPRVAPQDTVVLASDTSAPTQSVDMSGSILVNSGGVLNVTGGGYVAPTGSFNLTAKGGNVTLLDETTYFQFAQDFNQETPFGLPGAFSGFRVTAIIPPNGTPDLAVVQINPSSITSHVSIADGSILAHGFGGGGTFTLTAPQFAFGDSAASSGTALPLDFFSKTGFSSYNVKSYGTDLIPNAFNNGLGGYNAVMATQVVTVGAGETLSLDESLFSPLLTANQIATLHGFATGGDLNSVLTPIVPTDAWDSHPVNLSIGGLIELDVAQGGSIQGQAGGVLTVSQLNNQGAIRIPGGSIVQSQVVPSLYAQANALGVHSLSDVFTTNPDGSIDEGAANKLGLADSNGVVLTNAQVAASYSIYLLGNLKAGEGVRLAPGSVTDLSGEAIVNPRAAPKGGAPNTNFVDGIVVAGGSLTTSGAFTNGAALFHAQLGNLPYGGDAPTSAGLADVLNAEPTAAINLQGASATFERLTPRAATSVADPMAGYAPTLVWSNGGALTLGSGGTIAGAVVQARGGAPAAEGGTLTALDPVLIQNNPQDVPPDTFTVDTALISAVQIETSGFDTLVAQGGLSSQGNVTLNLRGSLFVTDRPQDGGLVVSSETSRDAYSPIIGSGGVLTVVAPYIGLDGGFQTFSTPAYGEAGKNAVKLFANDIDITGAVLFDQSVGYVVLSSSGDVRLIGAAPWQLTYNVQSSTPTNPSLVGQLAVNGRLTIDAAQVYPTTGTNFSITSAADLGAITFNRSTTATPATPYSAGGALTVQAASIVQDGIIRVPIGSLTLGGDSPFVVTDGSAQTQFAPATKSLTLGAGSITSVSADGLVIPYGATTDQIEWYFAPTNSNPLTAPPPAVLQLGGAKINVASGSTVDLKGGGDVYAYEFISGPGGSRDVLSQYNSDSFSSNNGYQYPDHRQVYAIVPGLSSAAVAAYDPIYSANYSGLYGPSQVGTRVYLNAAPGLAAGWYTLLPAQYAMLPGGMRVVQDTQAATPPPGGSATLLDGTDVVAGFYGAASGAYSSNQVVFDVQSQSVFRGYSDIALTYGNKTFTADAAQKGLTTPSLPIDAGRLILAPQTALVLAGTFETTPATGGRGSEVDISGAAIDIVDASGNAPDAGAIAITTASLSDLNAASLFIGGVRTDNADGTTSLNVTTSTIAVEAGATLSAPEILLATNGRGASLTVAAGASVIATGTVTNASTGDYLIDGVVTDSSGNPTQAQSAQGGFLRVANGAQRLLLRTGLDPKVTPGAVTIGGATLQGASVELESSGDLLLSPTARLSATSLALGATSVTFAPSRGNLTGLVITPGLQAQLGDVQLLTIQSENALKFESGTYVFGNLSLDTPGLANEASGTVTIKSGVLDLANSSADTAACGAAGAPVCGTGALAISAAQIVFENGDVNTYGFGGSATLSASQGIFADGTASMNFGTATVALDTPFVGDRGTGLADAATPGLTLVTTSAMTIKNMDPQVAFTAPAGTPGSTLTIDGKSIDVAGATLRATAGNLMLTATDGVALDQVAYTDDQGVPRIKGALLETPGYSHTFGDTSAPVTESAPAGRLAIVTLAGNIDVSSDSELSIYGGQGRAGALILSAHAGQVLADLSAVDSGPAGSGASLSLDTGGAFDLSAFATGAAKGFTGAILIEAGTGDLNLAAGDTLKAASVTLTANGGMVQSSGTIDVSGVVGGAVSLYGIDGVHLASGSLIDAQADGYGATDTRKATGGAVTLGVDGSGAITVDQGAVIDVGLSASDPNSVNRLVPIAGATGGSNYSYVAADQGGTVTFAAPVVQGANGADTVNVTVSQAAKVNGANSVVLEGFHAWDLAQVATQGFSGVTIVDGQAVLNTGASVAGELNFLSDYGAGTVAEFIQQFNIADSYAGLGGLASQANFHARPGVQLDYAGDIVLSTNWNLGAGTVDIAAAVKAGLMAAEPYVPGQYFILPGDEAKVFDEYTTMTYRVGGVVTGEPGILNLRAGGNLDLNGSITDGFFQFHDQTDPNYLSTALGGGDRTYQAYVQTSCRGGCGNIDDWTPDGKPRSYVYIPFPTSTLLPTDPFTDPPAPYSASANAPDALGSLANGAGDPLGSAQIFPLLASGKAVDSWSYQLVAGADLSSAGGRADPNPMSTLATSAATLTVAGQNVYGYHATAGTTGFYDTLDLGVTTSGGSTETVTAAQWEQAFIAAHPGVDPNAYTTIDFASAPGASRSQIQSLAKQFFAQNPNTSQLLGSGAQPTGLTTTLALAADFMATVSANFAQISAGYKPPREVLARGTIYATAPTLIRTGTGDIQLAASLDIDLSNGPTPTTLNSSGQIVDAKPGQDQLGGAAVYTIGHLADLGIETATNVATGQTVEVDLAANMLTSDNLATQSSEAYGYGNPVTSSVAGVLIADPVYAEGGGSVSLTAGRDVLGRRDTLLETELGGVGSNRFIPQLFSWIGSGAQPWMTGSIGSIVNALIDPQLFREGLGALGGGGIAVDAGRDISDLSVVATSSLTTGGAAGSSQPFNALVTLGGGDIAISGRDILGGRVDAASGQVAITAYGAIESDGTVTAGSITVDNLLRLRLTNATVDITAHGGVDVQGIAALGVGLAEVNQNQVNLDAQGFYSAKASVSILADGPVTLANSGVDLVTASTLATNETQSIVYPGSFQAVSLTSSLDIVTSGGNNIATAVLLYPSPTGTLRLIADGDIAPLTIAMEDASPSVLPGAFSTFATNGGNADVISGVSFDFPSILPNTSDVVRTELHNPIPTHEGDPNPNQIIAGGDITSLIFSSPKMADVSAGMDLINTVFIGQNLSPTDVTDITAGRDIIGTTTLGIPVISSIDETGPELPVVQGNTFVIGGPGAFFLQAGRNAGPFLNSAVTNGFEIVNGSYLSTGVLTWAGGIQSVGNLYNPWLAQQGASIVTEFGVSKGQDFSSLVNYYLSPDSFASLPDYLFTQTTTSTGLPVVDRNQEIYSLDLLTWLKSAAPSIISAFGVNSPASKVAQALVSNQPVTLSQALAVLPILADQRMPLIPWLQLNYASLLQSQFGTLNVNYQQAYDAFQIIPTLNQRQFLLKDVYFNELIQTSLPTSSSYKQYARGYQAVNTLFTASLGYTLNDLSGGANGSNAPVLTGNLDLRLATIQTDQGGDIFLLGPGGEVLAGSTVATAVQASRRAYAGGALFEGNPSAISYGYILTSNITSIPVGYEGVLTLQGGSIDGFTDGNFLLNQSRLFSEDGGDIALWSSNADLNAGQGPKTSANFPPIAVSIDENAYSTINQAAGVSGAGIAAFQPDPTTPAPDVFLIAPRGTVDAGAAGVRSAGSIFVAALQVANATNFQTTGNGAISGVNNGPTVNVSAGTAASAASAAAAQAAQAASNSASNSVDTTVITVDVLGYLAGLNDTSDDEDQKRKKK
jgi:filamentous hemagglutinin family protein